MNESETVAVYVCSEDATADLGTAAKVEVWNEDGQQKVIIRGASFESTGIMQAEAHVLRQDVAFYKGLLEREIEKREAVTEPTPGRTITEGECRHLYDEAQRGPAFFGVALVKVGITVTADPEPTNAEKLAEELKRALPDTGETVEWGVVARRLDEAGVKAPEAGGDDDHA